jgi:hypothetical protein
LANSLTGCLITGGSGGGTTGLRGDDGAGVSNSISASAPAVGEEDTYFEEKIKLIHAVTLQISATDRLLLFLHAIKFSLACFYGNSDKNFISLEYI